jgi:serine/threonine protein kinase
MPPTDDLIAGPHPSPEVLAAFLDGRLAGADLDALEPHVEACPVCCAFLRGLPNDPMSLMLRETVAGPSWELPTDPDPAAALADHPRYKLLEPLGSGGMGTVYKARHRVMDRLVALKVIHPRLLRHPAAVERFRREAKAAAKLAHPNIVTAHDAEQAGGCHFLVMEFLAGQTLAAVVADRGPLGVAEACGYARQAALGLQHAFEHGMVHRDVKPQNLMLTPGGRVKVLDFGLAHVGDDPDAGPAAPGDTVVSNTAAALTRATSMLGTPDYMAPEQAADARAVDVRTDVYALGRTLYFLLAGRPPFPGGSAADKLAAHRGREPQPLTDVRPDVPPALAAVVGRMLTKDPSGRYQTPAEVAEALRPFTEPTPIRSNRRRRLALSATMLAVASAAVATVPFLRPRQGSPPSDSPRPGEVLRVIKGHTHSVWSVSFSRDGQYALTGSHDGTVRRWDLATGREVTCFAAHGSLALCAALTPDGRRCLSAGGRDGTFQLWEVDTGVEIRRLRGHRGEANYLAISPDGSRALTGSRDNTMRLWDLATGDELTCFTGHTDVVRGVAFSHDGRKGVSASWDGTVGVWDLTTLQLLRRLTGHPDWVHSACFSPDGRRVLSGGANSPVRLWDVETGQELRTFAHGPSGVHSVAISPDGRRALSAGASVICLWDLETGAELLRLPGHTGSVWSVAFSPDGRRALSGSEDGTARLWNVELP